MNILTRLFGNKKEAAQPVMLPCDAHINQGKLCGKAILPTRY
jgi:hypothetical protein